jgi:hypothetical protein
MVERGAAWPNPTPLAYNSNYLLDTTLACVTTIDQKNDAESASPQGAVNLVLSTDHVALLVEFMLSPLRFILQYRVTALLIISRL